MGEGVAPNKSFCSNCAVSTHIRHGGLAEIKIGTASRRTSDAGKLTNLLLENCICIFLLRQWQRSRKANTHGRIQAPRVVRDSFIHSARDTSGLCWAHLDPQNPTGGSLSDPQLLNSALHSKGSRSLPSQRPWRAPSALGPTPAVPPPVCPPARNHFEALESTKLAWHHTGK